MIDDKSFIAARAKFSSAFMSISVKQTTVVGLLFEGLDECSCPIRRPWQVLSSTMILFLLGWLIGWLIGWFELVSLHLGGCDCLCYYYWVRKTFWATQTTSWPLDCIFAVFFCQLHTEQSSTMSSFSPYNWWFELVSLHFGGCDTQRHIVFPQFRLQEICGVEAALMGCIWIAWWFGCWKSCCSPCNNFSISIYLGSLCIWWHERQFVFWTSCEDCKIWC